MLAGWVPELLDTKIPTFWDTYDGFQWKRSGSGKGGGGASVSANDSGDDNTSKPKRATVDKNNNNPPLVIVVINGLYYDPKNVPG